MAKDPRSPMEPASVLNGDPGAPLEIKSISPEADQIHWGTSATVLEEPQLPPKPQSAQSLEPEVVPTPSPALEEERVQEVKERKAFDASYYTDDVSDNARYISDTMSFFDENDIDSWQGITGDFKLEHSRMPLESRDDFLVQSSVPILSYLLEGKDPRGQDFSDWSDTKIDGFLNSRSSMLDTINDDGSTKAYPRPTNARERLAMTKQLVTANKELGAIRSEMFNYGTAIGLGILEKDDEELDIINEKLGITTKYALRNRAEQAAIQQGKRYAEQLRSQYPKAVEKAEALLKARDNDDKYVMYAELAEELNKLRYDENDNKLDRSHAIRRIQAAAITLVGAMGMKTKLEAETEEKTSAGRAMRNIGEGMFNTFMAPVETVVEETVGVTISDPAASVDYFDQTETMRIVRQVASEGPASSLSYNARWYSDNGLRAIGSTLAFATVLQGVGGMTTNLTAKGVGGWATAGQFSKGVVQLSTATSMFTGMAVDKMKDLQIQYPDMGSGTAATIGVLAATGEIALEKLQIDMAGMLRTSLPTVSKTLTKASSMFRRGGMKDITFFRRMAGTGAGIAKGVGAEMAVEFTQDAITPLATEILYSHQTDAPDVDWKGHFGDLGEYAGTTFMAVLPFVSLHGMSKSSMRAMDYETVKNVLSESNAEFLTMLGIETQTAKDIVTEPDLQARLSLFSKAMDGRDLNVQHAKLTEYERNQAMLLEHSVRQLKGETSAQITDDIVTDLVIAEVDRQAVNYEGDQAEAVAAEVRKEYPHTKVAHFNSIEDAITHYADAGNTEAADSLRKIVEDPDVNIPFTALGDTFVLFRDGMDAQYRGAGADIIAKDLLSHEPSHAAIAADSEGKWSAAVDSIAQSVPDSVLAEHGDTSTEEGKKIAAEEYLVELNEKVYKDKAGNIRSKDQASRTVFGHIVESVKEQVAATQGKLTQKQIREMAYELMLEGRTRLKDITKVDAEGPARTKRLRKGGKKSGERERIDKISRAYKVIQDYQRNAGLSNAELAEQYKQDKAPKEIQTAVSILEAELKDKRSVAKLFDVGSIAKVQEIRDAVKVAYEEYIPTIVKRRENRVLARGKVLAEDIAIRATVDEWTSEEILAIALTGDVNNSIDEALSDPETADAMTTAMRFLDNSPDKKVGKVKRDINQTLGKKGKAEPKSVMYDSLVNKLGYNPVNALTAAMRNEQSVEKVLDETQEAIRKLSKGDADQYRKLAGETLRRFARALPYSSGRELLMRAAANVESKKRFAAVDRAMSKALRNAEKYMKKVDKQTALANVDKLLNHKEIKRLSSVTTKEKGRTLEAKVAYKLHHIRKAVGMVDPVAPKAESEGEVHPRGPVSSRIAEINDLLSDLDKLAKSNQNVHETALYVDLRLELAALEKYGNLKNRPLEDILEAGLAIEEVIETSTIRLAERMHEFEKKIMHVLEVTGDMMEDSGTRGRKIRRGFTSWVKASTDWLMRDALFAHRIQDATKYADEKTHKEAIEYMEDVSLRVSHATFETNMFREREIQKLDRMIADVYGLWKKKLDQNGRRVVDQNAVGSKVRELRRIRKEYGKYSKQKNEGLNKAFLMQLMAVTNQNDYAYLAEEGGVRAEMMPEIAQELTAEDMAFVQAMVENYHDRRKVLSTVMEEMTGSPMYSPDLNYVPGQFDHVVSGLSETVIKLASIPKAYTGRVNHRNDVDENFDILNIWEGRLRDDSLFMGFGELAEELRNTIGSGAFYKQMVTVHGQDVAGQFRDHLTDILSGGFRADSAGAQPIDKIRGYYFLTKMAGNVPVGFRQGSSVMSTGLEIGILNAGKHLFTAAFTQDGWKAMRALGTHPLFKARYLRGSSEELMNALRTADTMPRARRMVKLFMKLNQLGDMGALLPVAQGVYRAKLSEHIRHGMDAESAHEAAVMDTMHVVQMNQQSSEIKDQSQAQRRGGVLGRVFGMFKGTPRQYLSYEVTALRKVAAKPSDIARWKKLASVMTTNHVINQSLFHGLNYVIQTALGRGMDDEDKEKLLATYFMSMLLGPWGAMTYIGVVAEGVATMLMDEKKTMYGKSFTPIAGTFRDMSSLIKLLKSGNDKELKKNLKKLSSAVPAIKDIIRAFEAWVD